MTKLNSIIDFEDKKKLLLIDAHNLIFRTVHVADSQARQYNIEDETYALWKYLYINNIVKMIKQFEAEEVVLAIDSKNTWRKQFYSEYKAQRKAARDNSKIDFDKFFPILNVFFEDIQSTFTNIKFLAVEECEGDDIIGALSIHLNDLITIVSTDGDLNQLLIRKNVKQFDPMKKKFVEVLNPQNELEVKVITGDKGDNIPPIVPKCGEVKAADMVNNNKISELMELNEETQEQELSEKTAKNMGLSKIFAGHKPKNIIESYHRNRILIDLKYIPNHIQTAILEKYNNYPLKKMSSTALMSLAVKHRLPAVLENIHDIKNTFSEIEKRIG